VTKWTLLYRTAEGELLSSIHGLSIHLLPGAGSTPSAKTSIENV